MRNILFNASKFALTFPHPYAHAIGYVLLRMSNIGDSP